MKFQAVKSQFTAWAVVLGGLVLAMILGSLAGSGNIESISLIVGFSAVTALVLTMKTRIWILIPLGIPLTSGTGLVPGPFSVQNIVVGMAAGMMLIFHALHVVPNDPPKRGAVDVFIALLFAYGAFAYIRHPAGLEIFQSERIGAKPYIELIIAVTAYWVLGRARLTPALASKLPLWIVGVAGIVAAMTLCVTIVPSLTPVLAKIYEGVAPQISETPDTVSGERVSGYRGFGKLAVLGMVSYFSPLTCMSPLHPFRLVAFSIACFAILISGFRSSIVEAGLFVLTATYLRRGLPAIIALGMLGVLGLLILLPAQGKLFDLPNPVQRSLSFLPGDWDSEVVSNADDSIEWRIEMWQRVLKGESINDPIFGDGFGFTRAELISMLVAGSTDSVAGLMLAGDYHSGPLSTIRYFGIIGLLIYTTLTVIMAVQAYKLCLRTKGSPFYPVALFVGLPIIWHPLYFYFIFGSFRLDLGKTIIAAGLLRLVASSFELYKQRQGNSPGDIRIAAVKAEPVAV